MFGKKFYACTRMSKRIDELIGGIDYEMPWDTDTAWSRYEKICTALSGCQLASQYK